MIDAPEITQEEIDNMPSLWKRNGEYYGYPECCINDTIKRGLFGSLTWHQSRVNRYGFIPCSAHSQRIFRKELRIEDLISNRKCPEPFGT